ncbi:MAG: nitroreductase family deazaflavin-dependent oxidoreductase [Candidatus Rokubacteria bacterium]|nr:nitroreductase family deazaflavin-dependent oxidoreductase [Candidatus Rokubacteria bacterium]
MAWTYRLSGWRRTVNWLVRGLLAVGFGPPRTYLLTVPGRRSGRMRSTPVTLVEESGQRWLVAPYGEVGWVRNARAAGWVVLSRGRRSERVRVVELGAKDGAPVLWTYLKQVPVTRPFFDVRPTSPLEAFEAEAPRHPVFQITDERSRP